MNEFSLDESFTDDELLTLRIGVEKLQHIVKDYKEHQEAEKLYAFVTAVRPDETLTIYGDTSGHLTEDECGCFFGFNSVNEIQSAFERARSHTKCSEYKQ